MNLFRKKSATTNERPSVLVKLRLADTTGEPLDASTAWQALLAAFKDHPSLVVTKAEIRPDKEHNETSI